MTVSSFVQTVPQTVVQFTEIPVVHAQEIVPEIATTTPEIIKERIKFYADLYKVSEEVMDTIIRCESYYDPKAIGDDGDSIGLVQINKPSHPEITDEQAFDHEFSLDFLAKNLKEGRGKMWTCFKLNYAS